MEKLRISKSILSISTPGTHLVPGDHALARKFTRETNEEVAKTCAEHPDHFAFFASLPLPDVEGSIEEIDYALDHLGALGFALMTNAHGHYLGDASLDPVFKKLNERGAVVFMHPSNCCAEVPYAAKPLDQYPAPMLEFYFDTTRAVANLILSGTVERYTNITFIGAHCGAALAPLLERVSEFPPIVSPKSNLNASRIKELIKTRFYFDLAGSPSRIRSTASSEYLTLRDSFMGVTILTRRLS